MSGEFKPLLDRARANVEAVEVIAACCPLLRDLVDEACRVLVRCANASDEDRRGEENEDFATFVLYRQLIELVDGIEVLFSGASVEPATPILRSAFEASLSLEYILYDRAHYVDRSLSWTCVYLHRKIAKYELADASTQRGQQYAVASGKQFGPASPVPTYKAAADVSGKQAVLARPQFTSIEANYSAGAAKGRTPNWFSLLGGPRDR